MEYSSSKPFFINALKVNKGIAPIHEEVAYLLGTTLWIINIFPHDFYMEISEYCFEKYVFFALLKSIANLGLFYLSLASPLKIHYLVIALFTGMSPVLYIPEILIYSLIEKSASDVRELVLTDSGPLILQGKLHMTSFPNSPNKNQNTD